MSEDDTGADFFSLGPHVREWVWYYLTQNAGATTDAVCQGALDDRMSVPETTRHALRVYSMFHAVESNGVQYHYTIEQVYAAGRKALEEQLGSAGADVDSRMVHRVGVCVLEEMAA